MHDKIMAMGLVDVVKRVNWRLVEEVMAQGVLDQYHKMFVQMVIFHQVFMMELVTIIHNNVIVLDNEFEVCDSRLEELNICL